MRNRLLSVLVVTALAILAQSPSFDVASIKLHKGEVNFSADPSPRGRRVTATASTLLDMVTYAYAMRYDQISGGPNWVNSDHFDLDAKSEGEAPLTAGQARQMVQALLEERFHLKVRRETSEVPIYALVVAKNGPKFKPAAPDATGSMTTRGTEKGLRIEATNATMAQLVNQLSHTAGYPVMDRTNLAGRYVFTLEWLPPNRTAPPEVDAPSMFNALQEQLGLRLETGKGPMEKLVIVSAEKPSEN